MNDATRTWMPFSTVAITGGSGAVGRTIAQSLADSVDVTSVDVVPAPKSLRWREADVTCADAVRSALEGHDAIVHLAALLQPEDPEEEMIRVNVLGTWNVLHAARELGIRRVVMVSSETVSGVVNITNVPQSKPDYLPIDERHPLRPRETYATSKQLGEVMAESFARRGDIEIVVLRPTLILMPGWEEYVVEARGRDEPNLWSYVLVGDVAGAVRLALERETGPWEAFYISAADTFSREPTLTFMQRKFGAIEDIRRPEVFTENPHAAIWDISKAERLLGFVPRYEWRAFLRDGGYDWE